MKSQEAIFVFYARENKITESLFIINRMRIEIPDHEYHIISWGKKKTLLEINTLGTELYKKNICPRNLRRECLFGIF